MRTRGMTHQEIANELQVPRTAITSDIQYLRNQAKESIKEYAEYLPEQYHVYLSALDSILKHAYEILQTTDDNREKLQAIELFKDTHFVKLVLLLPCIPYLLLQQRFLSCLLRLPWTFVTDVNTNFFHCLYYYRVDFSSRSCSCTYSHITSRSIIF